MESPTRLDAKRFEQLLDRWNTHQVLRSKGASVESLAASRERLDAARLQVRLAA